MEDYRKSYDVFLLRLLWLSIFLGTGIGLSTQTAETVTEKCDPLNPAENVQLLCKHVNVTNNCKDSQPIGTIVNYRCMSFYIPYDEMSTSTISKKSVNTQVRCGVNGRWIGLAAFQSYRCVEECGKRLVNPKPLVVHGKATNATSWPWHAALFVRIRNGEYAYICGGTLIRNSVILTAAHCVTTNPGFGLPSEATLFKVVIGSISSKFRENTIHEGAQIFDVQNIYVSKNFAPTKDFQADIAILHLKGRVKFSEYAIPVCLPNDYAVDLNAIKPGRVGDVVGFGTDESGEPSQILKHGQVKVRSHNECFNRLKQTLSESQYCAGGHHNGEKFKTVCNGDSGGGYFYAADSLGKYYVHGIISTGGTSSGKVCENYGVFTRVFQFIFWIRDVLEQINGDIMRDLAANSKFPYILRGSNNGTVTRFLGLPREWDNRVESIQLVNIELEPKVLLDSLEYSRTINALNLTRVRLLSTFEGRIRLPYLKTFVLHHFREDFTSLRADYLGILFPFNITMSYLKSLIFFDKDINDDEDGIENHASSWTFDNITRLGTDIEITVDIFKLITINHEQGKLTLSHVPFSDKIMEGALQDPGFNLTYIALSRSVLLVSSLMDTAPIKSIIVHSVNRLKGTRMDSDTFRRRKMLEELRMSASSPFFLDASVYDLDQNVYMDDLPLGGMKYLALGHAILNYSRSHDCADFHFEKMETVSCFQCRLDSRLLEKFPSVFRNIRQVAVALREYEIDIRPWLKMENLRKIYLRSYDSYEYKTLRNFHGIEHFLKSSNNNGPQELNGAALLERETNNGTWTLKPLSLLEWDELNYYELGLYNFWTSSSDYLTETYLTTYEENAFKTGHYKFSGSMNGLKEFKFIPDLVQDRLSTIEIMDVEITPDNLLKSIQFTEKLESIILTRVKLLGIFEGKVKNLDELKVFKMDRLSSSLLGVDYVEKVDETLFNSLIPFAEPIRPPFVYVDYATTEIFTKSKLDQFDLSYDDCTMYYWNRQQGEFISAVKFTPVLLYNLTALGNSLKNPIRKLAVRRKRLYNLNKLIPSSVSRLNLQDIYLKSSNELNFALRVMTNLRDLRLADLHDKSNNSNPANLDLATVSKEMEFLEFSGIEIVINLTDTEKIPNLKRLSMVSFERCTFDVKVIENFVIIFQAKKLAILHSSADPIEEQVYSQEKILLRILSSETTTIEWIYTNFYNYDYEFATIAKTDVTKKLEKKLQKAGIQFSEESLNVGSPFILQKINGVWTLKNDMASEELESYFPKDKWTRGSNFGRNPSCQGKVNEFLEMAVRSGIREQQLDFGYVSEFIDEKIATDFEEQLGKDKAGITDTIQSESLPNDSHPLNPKTTTASPPQLEIPPSHTSTTNRNRGPEQVGEPPLQQGVLPVPSIANNKPLTVNQTPSPSPPIRSTEKPVRKTRKKNATTTTMQPVRPRNQNPQPDSIRNVLSRLSNWASNFFNRN